MSYKVHIKASDVIDVHVGCRIRLQRVLKGMSQKALAEGVGVTFQQVQKYETGTNRIGSSRLQAVARILSVPVAFFFEDGPQSSSPSQLPEAGIGKEITRFIRSEEGLALNLAFTKIQDANVRRKVIGLVKTLAKEHAE
ncbi:MULTISPECIES: helix-turn-helix domain-containing protein [Rhizobium/Agrobacterium group]|uniref:Transcriptional regulator n=2 Tax=Rhizobium/Agrobacterium group TaxID=227290 RepID=B9K4K3_ALLAM|nr:MULTISPECIES: helix-turn-helix transcriptional regulator [Rhizobium/Agrobacterium group]ACM39801.1 transcriptional regulator [Allorhizobium ampelinum S4]MCF1450433.1 helix-turn-helix domain-containing protein [Allorhizobium ampelinum]MCF1462103.1 helix-turn-helix domain-containing protein [Allorhizobium ampelinum]MCF1475408.1 helix-turn-helix domain-containing protein [Allorhizobium ampelinum]MCF1485696.1 helix-turn-helix domain-containing protein [Allorhizobium ampelinum]